MDVQYVGVCIVIIDFSYQYYIDPDIGGIIERFIAQCCRKMFTSGGGGEDCTEDVITRKQILPHLPARL